MSIKDFTAEEILDMIQEESDGDLEWATHTTAMIDVWLARGDGVAVYMNHDLGSATLGAKKFVSFGSPDALLEVLSEEDLPTRLPDIGSQINWRYQVMGFYRGESL